MHGLEFVLLNNRPNGVLNSNLAHAHWLGTSQECDAQDTAQALSDQTWDWLIVDHYALDMRWELMLRSAVKNIFVIDDIADRVHDCDVLLDQNFYADMDARYIGKIPQHAKLLLGPRYVLLRDEFRELRAIAKPRTGPVKRILVFFGGIDINNYTGLAIAALANIGRDDFRVDVVIGAQHPEQRRIEKACADHAFVCHIQTNQMAKLMLAADLSIGAGGSAIWERCSLGVPTIVLVLADNQRKAANDLNNAGILLNLGDAKQVTAEKLAHKVAGLMEDEKKRYELSSNSMNLVSLSDRNLIVDMLVAKNV